MLWINRRRPLDLSSSGQIMGIINATPDSFSDGGRFFAVEAAVAHGMALIGQGAAILDIGGESTRPGAESVGTAEEKRRVLPVIDAIRNRDQAILISVDTMKPEVAAAALEAGADIINDVTGFRDPEMVRLAAATGAGCVIMHMQGEPRHMQQNPHYDDVVAEVREFFADRYRALLAAGVAAGQMVFDPGIGFGKNLDHNCQLLAALDSLSPAGRPILLGVSRKSFIGKILRDMDLERRQMPTVALTSFGRESSVRIFRVHDVKPNLEALRMTEAILAAGSGVC